MNGAPLISARLDTIGHANFHSLSISLLGTCPRMLRKRDSETYIPRNAKMAAVAVKLQEQAERKRIKASSK
jgi:hypothetical protein